MKIVYGVGALIVIGGIGLFLFSNNGINTAPEGSISLSASLPSLDEGHYEGWAIFGEEKVSTGIFDAGSEAITLDRDLREADIFVITIEPDGDTDPEPSNTTILEGAITDLDTISLSFPVDLSNISGSYILATPTNGNNSDETSGVWFVQLPPPLSPSLNLPELPAGWVYEGWAVHNDIALSTGRFNDVAAADNFGDFNGTNAPGPDFPGEDFIQNAPSGISFPIDLADGNSLIVVSLEPDSNGIDPTGGAPFELKPLIGMIPQGAPDHESLQLDVDIENIPSGTIRFN